MSWEEYLKTMRPESDIHLFARTGDLEGLRRLDPETVIDTPDGRGYTPLILACYNGHREAAAYLLARGADPDFRDRTGNTALMGAAFKGYLEIVRLLIDSGADWQLTNYQGLNPLGFATMFGRNEVVAFLSTLHRKGRAASSSAAHPIE